MIEITNDLKDMIICALRYSIGRRTYVTSQTANFIKDNPRLIDDKVRQIMLNDLNDYFNMRDNCYCIDDRCDHDTWLDLKAWLEKSDDDE